jgi:endonuclease/exonuclease/phosphatase family metal-dependent hydrolase
MISKLILAILLLAGSVSAQTTFKAVTANLQHGNGTDSSQNFSRQITKLSDLGADIVAVQERTTGETGWDTPMASAGYSQAIYRENTPAQGDGPAILYKTSRVTIVQVYDKDLATGINPNCGSATPNMGYDCSTDVRKAAVAVKAKINNITFYFVSTHLCWSACADGAGNTFSTQRESQAADLLSWISSTLTGGYDIIIAGDMNFAPNYPKVAGGGALIKDLFTASYVDMWNLGIARSKATASWGDRDSDTVTDMPVADLTTRTHDTRRIDYIFANKGSLNISLSAIDVPDARATCSVALTNIKPTAGTSVYKECPDVNDNVDQGLWDIPDDQGVRVSDHNFVVATFNISNCQPPNYCARTDLDTVAMPTPTPPSLNGSFVDTISGKTVVRATDATWLAALDTAYNNQRYQVTSGSEQNVWSKSFVSGGQTHYRYSGIERTEGGTTHVIDWNGNTKTGALINGWGNAAWPTATNIPATSGGTWSYSNSDYFYAHDNSTNTTLKKFDFTAKTITTVKDWSSGCGATLSSGHLGEPTVDVTDTYFSTYGGGASQDLDDHVMIYKAGVGCRYFNTQTGTIGGDWGTTGSITKQNSTGGSSSWSGFYVHNARLSPDGNYVRITGCTPTCGDTIFIWDVNSVTVRSCVGGSDKCYGHTGWAWTKMINQENSGADAIRYATRGYSDLSTAGITYVAQPTISPAENIADSHLSSAYSNATQSTVITCGAAYRFDGSPPNGNTPYQRTHRPFDNEVFCMVLNAGANALMYRMTHTFTTARYPVAETTCSSVSRSGTTVSATCNSHGLSNGDVVIFTHTTSNALDGLCGYGLGGVTVTGSNTFTCTDESSGTVAAGTAKTSKHTGSPFEVLPRGNMSQDGRFYAFASDFMGQLGNTAGGACSSSTTCRNDVFIVEMAPVADIPRNSRFQGNIRLRGVRP